MSFCVPFNCRRVTHLQSDLSPYWFVLRLSPLAREFRAGASTALVSRFSSTRKTGDECVKQENQARWAIIGVGDRQLDIFSVIRNRASRSPASQLKQRVFNFSNNILTGQTSLLQVYRCYQCCNIETCGDPP